MAEAGFVSSCGSLSLSKSSFTASTSPVTRSSVVVPRRFTVRASAAEDARPKFNTIEEDRLARIESEYNGPQGFTPFSELVNGRLAQLAFVVGLVTELVSGKPMGEQIGLLLSPVAHLATTLSVTAANAQIFPHGL